MRTGLLIILIAFFSQPIFSQAWEWTYTDNKDNQEAGLVIRFDSENNMYLLSSYSNGYFGSGSGYIAFQIRKFSSVRQLLWTKDINAYHVDIRSFFISNDSLYIYGSYGGGSPTLIPGETGSAWGAFMMIIDKNGNYAGGNYIHNSTSSSLGSWECGQLMKCPGGFYFVTNLNGKLVWGSDTIVNSPGDKMALIKFDEGFKVKWKKVIDHTIIYPVHKMKLNAGGVVISGGFKDDMKVDNFQISGRGVYLLSVDSNGTAAWLKGFDGMDDMSLSLETDEEDNVYVYARAYQSASIGTITLTAPRDFTYLSKFSGNGNVLWAKKTEEWYPGLFIAGPNLLAPVIDTVNGSRFVRVYDSDGNILHSVYEKNMRAFYILPRGNSLLITGNYMNGASVGTLAPSAPGCFPCNSQDLFLAERSQSDFAIGVPSLTEEPHFNVYPNPSSGTFILSGQKEDALFRVYNCFGETVLEREHSGPQMIMFDISDQPKGIYLLETILEDKRYLRKLVLR